MTKVLVIGLDGATLDLIEPWAAAGQLPVFAELMRTGVHSRLRSVPNTDTAPAWATFATGLNPANHGLFNELGWSADRRTLVPVRGADRRGTSLWQRASDAGRRVVVINVPFSYPAEPVHGLMLAGVDAPGTDAPGFAQPPEFRATLRQAGIAYRIDAEVHIAMKEGRPVDALADAYAVAEAHTAALRLALADAPWDLAVVVYSLPDEMQHYFWRAMTTAGSPQQDAILEAHRFIERQITTLRADAGDDTAVVIFSDHGFGPLCATTELLTEWLTAQGFLRPCQPSRQPLATRLTGTAYGAVRRHLGEGQKAALRRALPRLRERVESDVRLGGIDWAGTTAYAGTSPWDIWINSRGREPHGIVAAGAEYEAVCAALIAALETWRDPLTGRKKIAALHRRESVYHGDLLHLAPDITITYDASAAPPPESLPGNLSGFDADHLPEGVFFAAGPGIAAGRSLAGASLEDVAPTVLRLLGLPDAGGMDGRVIEGVFA
jgi:predicted AlkP superfamily phosphohydrolase/phosphomutase